ncbi:PadR family transcriptional regulator [Subtercola sp. YIM 133946]|uniref:PadR family transcriptional regulator n=1 Tax=Subtercola sp. YIM 133946 TaxID=3118909 RepID=UPI002F93C403
MPAAAALTPLGLSALALLTEGPMHPYEMYQLLIRRLKNEIVKVRPGSLYHAIDRLERDGYARVVGTDRDGQRPERTTYEITETGRLALQTRVSQLLADSPYEYPEFALAISEAHNLPRQAVVQLLRVRLADLRRQAEEVGDMITQKQSDGAQRLFMLHAEHRAALLTAETGWLAALIDDLAEHRIAWIDDPDFMH